MKKIALLLALFMGPASAPMRLDADARGDLESAVANLAASSAAFSSRYTFSHLCAQACSASLSSQNITRIAGGGFSGGDNVPATTSFLQLPSGLAADPSGNLYIADTLTHRIRKIYVGSGIITTVAGSGLGSQGGSGGFAGDGGLAIAAALSFPQGLAFDSSGNLFIADTFNSRIRKVDARTRIITTVAGGGNPSDMLGDNGPATAAALNRPNGIAFDKEGNLYIADDLNNRIRKVDARTQSITTVAGGGSSQGNNLPATSASLPTPRGVAVDSAGNFFIVGTANRILKVEVGTNLITIVAGNGDIGFSGDNGPATTASLGFPDGIAVDGAGNLFIADTFNHRVRALRTPATPSRRRP